MTTVKLNDPSAFELVSGLWRSDRLPLITGRVLRSTNFNGDGLLDFSDVVELEVEKRHAAKRQLKDGDIIIERSGGGPKQPVGRVAFFKAPDEQAYFSSNFTTTLRIRDQNLLDPEFVSLYLHALYLNGETETLQRATTGIRNLDWQEYLNFEVPKLGLQRQRAIRKLISKVRKAYQCEQSLLTLHRELKQQVMRQLFTCGMHGEAQKETEIGPMPVSWNPRSILELCDIWSGGTPRKSVAGYWSGDIPWVSGKDLKLPALEDVIDHISKAGVDAGSRIVPKGSVLLLVRGMGLARDLPVAVIKRPMAFNQDVKALVTRGQYSGEFIRSAIYAGKERLLSQIVPSAHGTMTLNLNDVESFKIACPPDNDEATEVVTILDALEQRIALHQQKKSVLNELFRSLLHKLIRGEISVDDLDLSVLSNEEPQRQTEAEVQS